MSRNDLVRDNESITSIGQAHCKENSVINHILANRYKTVFKTHIQLPYLFIIY